MLMPGFNLEQLEAVLDTVSDGVVVVDRHFAITYFNRAAEELSGFRREDVLGQHCYNVLRSPACSHDCLMARTLRTGEVLTGENMMRTRTAGEAPVHIQVAALRDADGTIVGGVKTFKPKDAAYTVSFSPPPSAPGPALPILAATERSAIESVLRQHNWNQVAAARELGISRTTLWRKMRKLGIKPHPEAAGE